MLQELSKRVNEAYESGRIEEHVGGDDEIETVADEIDNAGHGTARIPVETLRSENVLDRGEGITVTEQRSETLFWLMFRRRTWRA